MSPEEIKFTIQLANQLLKDHHHNHPFDPQLVLDLIYRCLTLSDCYLQLYKGTQPHFPPTLKMGDSFVVLDQIIAIEMDLSEDPPSDICGVMRLSQDIDYPIPLRYRTALLSLLCQGLDLESLTPEPSQ